MKRILLFTFSVIFCLFLLCSCFVGGSSDKNEDDKQQNQGNENTGNEGEGNTEPDDEGAFLAKGTVVTVISNDSSINIDAFSTPVFLLTETPTEFYNDSVEKKDHELIVGKTSRELSLQAYRRIDRNVESDDDASFVIYSDGSSLAFAYNCKEAYDEGIKYLAETLFSSSALVNGRLVLKMGVVAEDTFSIEEYYQSIGLAELEEKWHSLEKYIGGQGIDGSDAIVSSLRTVYSIYTPKLYLWLADLYDPEAGGFYYSNSGRDTEGFAPDIESTRQALNILTQNGVITSYSQLPTEMKEAMINFVQSRQSEEDGYFYHPQWANMETTTERRSRDLNWAIQILSDLGAKPLYPTALDRLEGNAPVSALTERLGASGVCAVSSVVPTALPSHLQSESAFLAYLNSFDWEKSSYAPGNTIAAQASQIKAAGLMDVAVDFFNELMNPATGMWDDEMGSNDAINGYLKVSAVYVTAKVPLPYAEVAAEGCIMNILSDEFQTTVCHTYNPWAALTNIRNTLVKYGDAEDRAAAERIVAKLYERLPDYIAASRDKIVEFNKMDGSFSYTHEMSSSHSQGMPVAVWGTNEGDVNATVLSMSLTGYMFQALGIDSYRPNIYTIADTHKFVKRIGELGPITKTQTAGGPKLDFEDGDLETLLNVDDNQRWWNTELTDPEYLEENKAYAYITEDGDNNVMEFGRSESGMESRVEFRHYGNSGASRYIAEMRFRFVEGELTSGSGWMFRFAMYHGGRFFYLLLSEKSDGNLSLGGVATLEKGVWYDVKLEYYSNSRKNVCMVYVNGEYAGEAGSSDLNYSDSAFSKFFVEIRKDVAGAVLQLDEVVISSDNVAHESEENGGVPETRPTLPEGDASPGKGLYYTDVNSDGLKVDYNEDGAKAPNPDNIKNVEVELTEGGFVLFYKSDINGEAYLRYNFPERSESLQSPVGIFELDFKLGNVTTSVPSRIGIWNNGLEAVLYLVEKDGSFFFGNKSGEVYRGSPSFAKDEWVNLRFEYYFPISETGAAVVRVYVDNETYGDMSVSVTNKRIDSATGLPSPDRVNIYLHQADESAYMCLDNLYFGYIDKAFDGDLSGGDTEEPEDPEIPIDPPVDIPVDTTNGYYPSTAPGTRYDYAGGDTLPEFEWLGADGEADATVTLVDGRVLFDKISNASDEYIFFTTSFPYSGMTDPIFILEMKLEFSDISTTSPGKFYVRGGGYKYTIALSADEDGNVYLGSGDNKAVFNKDTEYMVRLECDVDPYTSIATVKVIVSEDFTEFNEAATITVNATADENPGKAHLYLSAAENGSVYVREVYVGYTDSGVAEEAPEEEEPEEPVTEPSPTLSGEDKKDQGGYFTETIDGDRLASLDFSSGNAPKVQVWPLERAPSVVSAISGGILKLYKVNDAFEEYVQFGYDPSSTVYESKVAIFEADVAFGGIGASATLGRITLAVDKLEVVIGLLTDENGKLRLGTETAVINGSPELTENTWYNLRFEYLSYKSEAAGSVGVVRVYLDGEFVTELTGLKVNSRGWENVRCLVYLAKDDPDSYLFLDNLYLGSTEDTVEDPETPEVPEKPETPEMPEVDVDGEDRGNGEYYTNEEIVGDRYGYNEDGAVAPSVTSGANFAGTSISDNALKFEKLSGEGESYLQYSGPSMNWKNENYCTVIEFDMKLEPASALSLYHLRFRLDSSDYIDLYPNTEGGDYSLGAKDSASLKTGEWVNVRFEIFFIEDKENGNVEYAKIFVNGEHTATKTLQTASGYNSRLLIYWAKNAPVGSAVYLDNILFAHIDKAYE